ncbi:MAG: ATPase [Acidobacteriota bacterium]
MIEIIAILDEVEEVVKDSKKVPFSGKVLLEPEYLLDRLDRIRAILPEEIEAAKLVITEQERIYEEAQKEAKGLIDDTKTQAARMVDMDEITKHARQVAEEVIGKAESVSREIRAGANDYADEVLALVEKVLRDNMQAIQMGRSELKEQSKKL